jgi:hypothetical protein
MASHRIKNNCKQAAPDRRRIQSSESGLHRVIVKKHPAFQRGVLFFVGKRCCARCQIGGLDDLAQASSALRISVAEPVA